MEKKSKFIFNELKSTILNELIIIDSSFTNVNVACIISNSIK